MSTRYESFDEYGFRHFLIHLARSKRSDTLCGILLDFQWLQDKLNATDTQSLIEDYDLLDSTLASQGSNYGLIQEAIRLSANVLSGNKDQLPSQLTGRLSGMDNRDVRQFVESIRTEIHTPWLRPMHECLVPPGTLLSRTINPPEKDNSIFSIIVSPLGGRFMTGSQTLRVWDSSTGRCEKTIKGHSGNILAMAAVDEKTIVSSSVDKSVKVWNLETGTCLQTFSGHTDHVKAIAVAPEKHLVFSGSQDHSVKVWNLETGECLRTLQINFVVNAIVLILDDLIALGLDNRTIEIWNWRSGKQQKVLTGHEKAVEALVVTPQGDKLISASSDRTLKIWDVKSETCLRTLEGHNDRVKALAITRDGRQVISGGYDFKVKIWNIDTGDCSPDLDGHSHFIYALSVSQDDRYLISGSVDGVVKIWDMSRIMEQKKITDHHTEDITCIASNPNGIHVLSASMDGSLREWDRRSFQCRRVFSGHRMEVTAAAYTRGGKFVVSGGTDYTIRVWDVNSGACVNILKQHGVAQSLVLNPNGQQGLFGMEDGSIQLINLKTGKCERTYKGQTDQIKAIVLSPDGQSMLTASSDHTARAWRIRSNGSIIQQHAEVVVSIRVTPDGLYAITCSRDGAVKVWDLKSKFSIKTLPEITAGWECALSISPNGKYFSVSDQNKLSIVNFSSQKIEAEFIADAVITSSLILADGQVIIGDRLGNLIFLQFEHQSLRAIPVLTAVEILPEATWKFWQSQPPSLGFDCPVCGHWNQVEQTDLGKESACQACSQTVFLNSFIMETNWKSTV